MSSGAESFYGAINQLAQTDLADSGAVRFAALRMEELLLAAPADPAEDVTRKLGQEVLTATNLLYERFETNLELDFAARILADEAQVEDYPLFERFTRLISQEVDLADIKPSSGVVFIGSGPFPISPILIHRLSGGAKVACFDSSTEACEVSQKVIKKLGLEDAITVKNVLAQEAKLPSVRDPGEMGSNSIAIVALLAQPKEKIIQQVVLSEAPGFRIVMRNSEGNRRLIYEGVDPSAVLGRSFTKVPGFDILAEYHAGVEDTISGTVITQRYIPWIHKI